VPWGWSIVRNEIENIVDADPVAVIVREILADRAQWTGTASDLLQAGINIAGNAMVGNRSGWPKNPRALAGRLRAQTFLRTLGIEISFGREGRLGARTIIITATEEKHPATTSALSAASALMELRRGCNALCLECSINCADAADGADAK
jgi:hypothetical protein